MERDLGEAQNHYQAIAQLDPQRQGTVQRELSNLLGKLISDLHGAVHSEPAPTPEDRAQWCWKGYGLGQRFRALQADLPSWLWHLDEQLVRQGAIDRRSQLAQPGDASQQQCRQWRRQALTLLLHLGQLHQPCPEWVLLAAQEEIAASVDAAMAEINGAEAAGASAAIEQLRPIFRDLARLPLPEAQRQAVQLAAQRGIWSLELLEETRKATRKARQAPAPAPAPASAPPPAQVQVPPQAPTQERGPAQDAKASQKPPSQQPSTQEPAPQQAASPRDPRQLYKAIGLGVTRWLEDHPEGSRGDGASTRLVPVLRPGQPVVHSTAEQLHFNLAPLLQFPNPELLDELVPAFFLPLKEKGRGPSMAVAEACSHLWGELQALWKQGQLVQAHQWRGLVYSSDLWQRCGGKGLLGARPEAWSLPVGALDAGTSLLRPGNVELAALQTVLGAPDSLEDLLADVRRRHHDRAWMEQQRDHWWFDPSDGSENLRRLHTNAGFYASSHAPLESLQRWSQGTLRALMGSPVLFGNSSITQMYWPIAQAIQRQTGSVQPLVQWPGEQAFYDAIAGQELLFVTPLAADVERHHRSGKAFTLFHDITIRPYGLRCLDAPISVYPNRPGRGFEDSLNQTLESIDRLYKQKPFAIFTASCGAYGLPLCDAVKQRYGVPCYYIGNLMHTYLGILQRTSQQWKRNQRINENWTQSELLDGIPGISAIEDGRYLKFEQTKTNQPKNTSKEH